MKVAVINPFGNSSGHSLNYSSKLCQSCSKQNVDLTLFTSGDFKPEKIINEKINFKCVKTEVKSPTFFKKNYSDLNSLLKYGFYRIKGNLKVLNTFKKHNKNDKFDVVHIIGGETIISIFYLSLFSSRNTQLILTIHNSDFAPSLYKDKSKLKYIYKQFIKYLLKRFYFKRFSKIMVHGEQMKKDLLKQIPSINEAKIFPINIGMDLNLKSKDIENRKSNKPIILFFGILRKDKGLEILLESIKSLKNDNFILNVFGKPTEFDNEEIEFMIQNTNKGNCINSQLRYFDDKEINGVFSNCDYVILPYMKTFKAQSVVLTLAAAYKKTLICSDTGQNGFDVKKYNLGYTFEAENSNDLKLLLEKITDNTLTPISDVSVFDNYIEKNSWENMGKKIYQMYNA